jgi:prepilin-type processing-associated H-X9-DG protein
MLTLGEVSDGTSTTFMVGEKYLNPDAYLTGNSSGDNECSYTGDDFDHYRWAYGALPPVRQDQPGYDDPWLFGSAHAAGLNMAMCDGSVRLIKYEIDATTFALLCNRRDGKPVAEF